MGCDRQWYSLGRAVRTWVALRCLSLVALAGCGFTTGGEECGPEFRVTASAGEVRDTAGTLLGWADVGLREERGPNGTNVLLLLQASRGGGAFPRPVSEARLIGLDGVVVLSLPLVTSVTGVSGASHDFVPADRAAVTRLYAALMTAGTRLEVTPTGESAPRFTALLRLRLAHAWQRAICE
jgi:hypothetical protein